MTRRLLGVLFVLFVPALVWAQQPPAQLPPLMPAAVVPSALPATSTPTTVCPGSGQTYIKEVSAGDLGVYTGGNGCTSGTVHVDFSNTTMTLAAGYNLTVDTNTLAVNASTHRVGIGTTSPIDFQEIHTGTDRNFVVRSGASLGSGNAGTGIEGLNDAHNATVAMTVQGSSVVLSASGNNDMTVSSTFITHALPMATSGSGMAVANVGANSCGTTAATIAGNNNAFVITVGATSGTQCRVAFTAAASTEWDCAANDDTTTIAVRTTPIDTTHTDLIGAFVAGDKVTGICFAR